MFLRLESLSKLFDNNNGVKNIDLEVEEGEFVTLLGPSGCGKTTTLNLIGGFLQADSGRILLDGVDIKGLAPEERPVSTVFQSYALFPHLNVEENVAYGIKYYRKKTRKDSIILAKDYIKDVGLEGYERAKVGNLSGGQQQRVALARAMATNPKILLLDEPLSNLDAGLRIKLREELKTLQKKFNITMIFVTHDQSEALSLSDKVVVMDDGNIVQIGSPSDIYFNPINEYIASFVGQSNILDYGGEKYLIRPEDIRIERSHLGEYRVVNKMFMGNFTQYRVEGSDISLEINSSGYKNSNFMIDDRVDIEIEHKFILK